MTDNLLEKHESKGEIIEDVLYQLLKGNREECRRIVNEKYPFVPPAPKDEQVKTRRYTPVQMTKIFLRDGFIDRYSGEKLLFPGIFRVMSVELTDLFPAHSNWKMTETHIVYWELFATIDHIHPVTKGGTDAENNLVTTSMLKNMAKSNYSLDEIGWTLKEPGKLGEWDGLTGIFTDLLNANPELRKIQYIRTWEKALYKCIN